MALDNSIPLLSIEDVIWTSEEIAYIEALHQRGSIKIATKVSSAVYEAQEDGSITGFHYSVLREFADLTNISIDVEVVSWDDYFYKEGEDLERAKVDPAYSFVPTLIENVDLYIDGITSLAWRERMFDIIKYVPSRQLLVSRENNIPSDIADLDNKVFAMVQNTSMEQTLELLSQSRQINILYEYVENFDAMEKMVSENKVDYTVYDSDRAFTSISNYENLTIAWPITDVQMEGWAVNKNNPILKGIIEKYMTYAQATGIFDSYWEFSYGVTFVEYLKLLDLGSTED